MIWNGIDKVETIISIMKNSFIHESCLKNNIKYKDMLKE